MDSNNEPIIEKRKLITDVRTVIMSTVDSKGMPNASYAPVGVDNDNNLYVYISELSKHTSNLKNNNVLSVMLIEDEAGSENIFARKRLTMNAKVELIERGALDWEENMMYLEDRFGKSIEYLKGMTDFHLFKIVPEDALLVYGFGKAFRFSGEKMEEMDHLNEKGHKR